MRILLASAAILFVGFATVSAGQQADSSRPFDSIITHHEVMLFQEFRQAVQLAASQSGISPGTADQIVQGFAQANKLRVIPVTEWRAFLLESLYSNDIPYPVAKEFLRSLRGNADLPVDTGFLEAIRTVDLGGKKVYQIGKSPYQVDLGSSLTAPRATFQPLPLYPDAAKVAGVQGIVLLKCVVLEDGTVANCTLERTAGWGIDESALLTVQDKWKFEPARLNGQPVAVWANIEVSMRLY
jgi:TonB family protein